MADAPRILCDEILVELGRWLRIAGYDTAIAARGCRDRDLVEQARDEEGILLTRDRRLVEIRRASHPTIVLERNNIDACAEELVRRLSISRPLIRSAVARSATYGWKWPIGGSSILFRRASGG